MGKNKAGILVGAANLQTDICELCEHRSRTQACPYKQVIFSVEKGMENHSCLIIIEVGRELIPVVLLREEYFVLAFLFKWKHSCELKNGMLSFRSGFFTACQRKTVGKGKVVIDF